MPEWDPKRRRTTHIEDRRNDPDMHPLRAAMLQAQAQLDRALNRGGPQHGFPAPGNLAQEAGFWDIGTNMGTRQAGSDLASGPDIGGPPLEPPESPIPTNLLSGAMGQAGESANELARSVGGVHGFRPGVPIEDIPDPGTPFVLPPKPTPDLPLHKLISPTGWGQPLETESGTQKPKAPEPPTAPTAKPLDVPQNAPSDRPDFPGMTERMRHMTPDERRRIPLATGYERRPGTLMRGREFNVPPFMRNVPGFFKFISGLQTGHPDVNSIIQGLSGLDPRLGEFVRKIFPNGHPDPNAFLDALSAIDPRITQFARQFMPQVPKDGNNVPPGAAPQPAPGVAPRTDDGGGATARPDVPAAPTPAPNTGAPTAPVAPVAPGVSAAPSVPPEPADGDVPAAPVAPNGGATDVPGAGPATFSEKFAPAENLPQGPNPLLGPNAYPIGPAPVPAPADTPLPRSRPQGALDSITRTHDARESTLHRDVQKVNFGQPMNARLAADRQRYAAELRGNPALRDKLMRIMVNEQSANPQGVQSIVESAMNRASIRGTSLEQQLRWHGREHGGYYAMGNMGRGYERHADALNQAIENALAGSNISNFATDNSSGSLARRESASGRFRYRSNYTGETFFAPGTAERGFARKWDRWLTQMQAPEAPAVAER